MFKLNHKRSAVLTWDKSGNIIGAIGERIGDNKLLLKKLVLSQETEESSFEERLADVYFSGKLAKADKIIAGGYWSRALCFEIKLLKMAPSEIKSALEFELSNRLPLPIGEMMWDYRIIREIDSEEEGSATKHLLIRVIATPEEERTRLVDTLKKLNIRVDVLASPLFWIDPVLGEQDVYLEALNANFMLQRPACDGLRHVVPCDDDSSDRKLHEMLLKYFREDSLEQLMIPSSLQNTALLTLAYANLHINDKRLMGIGLLPRDLKPIRCKWMKRIMWSQVAALVFIGFLLLLQLRSVAVERFKKIKEHKAVLNGRIENLNRYLSKNSMHEKNLYALANLQRGLALPLQNMALLAKTMPRNMSIYQFRSDGYSADLVLKCPADESDINGWLVRLKPLEVSNIRYRRNYDGSRVLYFRLTDLARKPLAEKKFYEKSPTKA